MNAFFTAKTCIMVLYGIFYLIACWKVFTKMGVPGWKGIIPVYNLFVLLRLLRRPMMWFWGILGSSLVIWAISLFPYFGIPHSFFTYSAVLLFLVVNLFLTIGICSSLSRSFGYGGWMTAGLIFFPVICLFVLGFGIREFERRASEVEYRIAEDGSVVAVPRDAQSPPPPPVPLAAKGDTPPDGI